MSTARLVITLVVCTVVSVASFAAAGYWLTVHPPCASVQRLCPHQ